MPFSESVPAALSITLFGPLQVQVQDHLLPSFRSRKPLWLLILLTLRSNRPVDREWLAGTLWPDTDQSHAFANLRPGLSELRKALASEGYRLQSPDRHTLLLDLTDAEVDLFRFDAAIQSGTLSDLQQAVALYRGPLLEGCNEEWASLEREAREQECLQALQKLGDASLTNGDYDAAAGYYQRAVRIDPWGEAARRGWMEALSRNGDTNAALQVYREFVAFLQDDPKATPDEQTTALYQRLRAETHKRASAPTVGTHAADPIPTVRGYLPHALTDLVGREDERLEVAARLRHSRLVTLTGVGGIGKTRLAREVAGEAVREYADGVWLVALESLSEGRMVIQQIASVLGLREEPGQSPLQSVTEHLRPKRLLLVLDNCEHLLEASVEVVTHLLRECGEVRILATSREALGIPGETVWSVPALAVPEMQHLPEGLTTLVRVVMGYESVQLFVERAQAVQKSFVLSSSNARLVAQACQQLEGIPLAIELAAARARAMSVEQIASRLNNELALLTGGSRTAQLRQQTLRATLDWSYALLTEAERSLLRRLSVFAGGWTLEAAEAVASDPWSVVRDGETVIRDEMDSPAQSKIKNPKSKMDVLDALTSLVDKSLVLFEEREAAGGRYRLLEMVRQYAAESLQASGEVEAIKTRHRDWFLALVEAAESQLRGAEQAAWGARLDAEQGNLRAALIWSLDERKSAVAPRLQIGVSEEEGAVDTPIPLRFCSALQEFWSMRGKFAEGRAWCERSLQAEGAQERTSVRARALNGMGVLVWMQGDYVAAQTCFEESLAIRREIRDHRGIAGSLNNLGNVAKDQADYAAALDYYEQALAINRGIGNRAWEAANLSNLGIVADHQGDYAAARAHYEESLSIRQEVGDRQGVAGSLNNLGDLAKAQYDYAAAHTYFEQALAINREIGNRAWEAINLSNLGTVARSQGDLAAARARYEESLAIKQEIGDRLSTVWTLEDFAVLMAAETTAFRAPAEMAVGSRETRVGIERVVRLRGATQAMREQIGAPLPLDEREEHDRLVEAAQSALSEEAFATAWEEGRAMTLEQAIAYVLEGVAD